jgi:hypothetical protein
MREHARSALKQEADITFTLGKFESVLLSGSPSGTPPESGGSPTRILSVELLDCRLRHVLSWFLGAVQVFWLYSIALRFVAAQRKRKHPIAFTPN